MSHVYLPIKEKLLKGDGASADPFDFVNDDLRLILVMSNTTADTETNISTVSAFTTLDEYDGSGYPVGFANRKALANEAVTLDVGNARAEFDADNTTFSSLSAGTRQAVGAILYRHKTADTDSEPIVYIDTGGFPFDGNGGDVTFQWDAEGILQQA